MDLSQVPPSRKRNPNFSDQERNVLITEVLSRKSLLGDQALSDGVTRKQVEQGWKDVTDLVNMVSSVNL